MKENIQIVVTEDKANYYCPITHCLMRVPVKITTKIKDVFFDHHFELEGFIDSVKAIGFINPLTRQPIFSGKIDYDFLNEIEKKYAQDEDRYPDYVDAQYQALLINFFQLIHPIKAALFSSSLIGMKSATATFIMQLFSQLMQEKDNLSPEYALLWGVAIGMLNLSINVYSRNKFGLFSGALSFYKDMKEIFYNGDPEILIQTYDRLHIG